MQFLENEVCQFTESIWESLLGVHVSKSTSSFNPDRMENILLACIHITGEWQGTVMIHCPIPLGRKYSSILFGISEQEAASEDIQDALGELVNQIGGNLKSLLPEPCQLSLPTVVVTSFSLRVPGSEVLTNVTFENDDNLFTISILRRVTEDSLVKAN